MVYLHWSYLAIFGVALVLFVLWLKSRTPTEYLKSETERQGRFYRGAYIQVLWLLFVLIILGFVTIAYAVVLMRIPKADLTEFYFMQGGLVGAFTTGFVSHVTGTSISSNKNGDALRMAVRDANQAQVDEKVKE